MVATTKKLKDDEKISLVVTAFGPFGGVDNNPSNSLLQEVSSFLENGPAWKVQVKDKIKELLVIETSAEGVQEALDELTNKISKHKDVDVNSKLFCLHLGVNVNGSGYHLEECAYNDATFRIPDQRNYQPKDLPILPNLPLADLSHTNCPVADLVEHLTQSFPAVETKVSTDPGRFVCNYLYYLSLNKLQKDLSDAVDASLFLHIPPFEKIPREIQIKYLAEVMRVLTRVELS